MQFIALVFLGLILLGLATCRLSLMFVKEAGPMNVFKRIRDWAEIQEITLPNGETQVWVINEEQNLIGGILSCTWCASVWFSGILILYSLATWFITPLIAIFTLLWLSVSMISIILDTMMERLQT